MLTSKSFVRAICAELIPPHRVYAWSVNINQPRMFIIIRIYPSGAYFAAAAYQQRHYFPAADLRHFIVIYSIYFCGKNSNK